MNNTNIFQNSFLAFGSRCDVVFTNVDQSFAVELFQLVKKEIERVEQRLDAFSPGSSVFELNRAGNDIWISVDDDLWEMIALCYDFYLVSNGAFDVAAAPLVNLWKKGQVPSSKQIEAAKQKSGFDKVELDPETQRIRFKVDGVEFDFGAIGKGIALDFVKPVLEKEGVKNAIISFGESSILALGTHPNGENWPLGIRNPKKMNDYVHVILASNKTVTTSGSILYNGEGQVIAINRVVSPESGLPVSENKIVSVKSESAAMGDFLATAWLILPENDKQIVADKFKDIEILEVDFDENSDYKTKLTIY